MILTIDNIAYRYKILPTEVLERGTTFDLYVIDIATKWRNYQQEKQEGKQPSGPSVNPSIQEMQAMMARVRAEND